MKKYLISGFNTVQDVKLEVGTYTLVAYVKSMHGDVYTFALGDGTDWEEFSIDVIQGQLCKVWLTFTIDKKATKFKPIANNFTEELPVYVADLQLTRGNIPVESGASPFDIDQILNDLHDEIDAIEDFTEGAFLDGLLSREEKTQLRASLDSIGSIVESVKGSYDKLLDNPFIHENTMDSITARYYAFIASWISDGDPRGLKPVILWIVNGDNIVDQNERDEKDRALNAFNDALYAYNQAEKEVYNDVGENSIAPIIIDGFWAFWNPEKVDEVTGELGAFEKSEFSAIGDDGHAPIIRDGYWYEWNPALEGEDKYQNTGVRAEGLKGDGVQQKFLSADEKPEKPIGDAVDWNDIPDEEEAPDVPLEPIGDNLYDAQYLINQGGTAVDYGVILNVVGNYHIINPTKLKANTQYSISYKMSGYGSDYRVVYNYTIGTPDIEHHYYTGNGNVVTDPNRTLQSVKIEVDGQVIVYTHPNIYELGKPTVQAKPIWTIFRNIVDGIASEWSDPVKWLGEGTPGKDGKDGKDGMPGKDGTSVNIKGSKDSPNQLPTSGNSIGDGYLINGDLWVYDGVSNQPPAPIGWGNAGRIKGDKGKDGSSYLVLGYWSSDYEYQQSDAGIPIVKRPGSATFQAYKLIVPISTQGHFYNSSDDPRIEWELVDSSEFTYMLEAYIEVLQAELITAEKIEALDISVKRLTTPFLTVDNSDATYDSSRRVYKINNDLNLSADSFDTHGRDFVTWIELPDDNAYIGTRVVVLNANFPPYTYSQHSAAPTVVCVSSSSKSKYVGVGGEPKTGSLDGRQDPYAIAFVGCMVEFICVPRVIDGLTYPYWVATNWSESIEVVEWT